MFRFNISTQKGAEISEKHKLAITWQFIHLQKQL
jgi:hypothetical protein